MKSQKSVAIQSPSQATVSTSALPQVNYSEDPIYLCLRYSKKTLLIEL